MEIYSYLSDSAKQVLEVASNEAKELKQNYVGTEHLLLGLMHEQCPVAYLFKNTSLTLQGVREYIADLHKNIDSMFSSIFSYTAKAKTLLQRCAEAAKREDRLVEPENIAMELLKDKSSIAVKCLNYFNVNADDLLEKLLDIYGGEEEEEEQEDVPAQSESVLYRFAKNLNALAEQNKLDPVIGRETELQRVLQIMCRRTKNNPVLIGEPGVGKTVIAEALAQRIVSGNVPDLMKNKKVFSIEIASLVAGSKYRGEFEDRMRMLVEEVKKRGDVILFIDEIHTIVGAGAAEGSVDAANILKPALSKGEVQALGATTLNEYKKYIEKDVALERRFQPVMVNEPTPEETVRILKGIRPKYEEHHKVKITDEAIEEAVKLTTRYVADRYLPDKAIDVIDEAASKIRLACHIEPPDIKDLERKLEDLTIQKKEAVSQQQFEQAADLRDEEKKVKAEIDGKMDAWKRRMALLDLTLKKEDIAEVVAFWTGIPVSKISESEKERLIHLEEVLHKRVIGQDEAVKAIARAVRRSRAGIADPKKPVGSFLFLGPTGVGKTELCKALAEALFGDEDALIRIDMSEYMELYSVSKLVGSPPGYVGYEEGGQLTERVRRKPYSVILFDEVEKAHPDVFNIMLQLLDDGRLTDSQGRTVNFRNTVVVLTSNAGASTIKKQSGIGFGSTENSASDYERMKEQIMTEVKKIFKPEFINRLDDIIAFRKLSKEELRQIVDLMLHKTFERIAEKGISVTATEAAKNLLAEQGYDPVYGARPLKRLIQKVVDDKLAERILADDMRQGGQYTLAVEKGQFVIRHTDVHALTPAPEKSIAQSVTSTM